MRIGLLDDPGDDGWRLRPNRFWALGEILVAAGHDVFLLGGRPWPGRSPSGLAHRTIAAFPVPLLTSLNRAREAAPLTRAYAFGQALRDEAPDLVIAPFAGGIAHGLLMARDCGEGFDETRVALWWDGTARASAIADDDADDGLRALISDALERACLARADALIAGHDDALDALSLLAPQSGAIPELFRAALPAPPPLPGANAPALPAHTLAFVGRLDRASGAVAFIDAVEALGRAGALGGVRVVFIGPYRREAAGVSATWLGLRAAAWRFPFALIEETDPLDAMRRLAAMPNALAVVSLEPGGRLPFAAAGPLALSPEAIRADDFPLRLAAALTAPPPAANPARHAPTDWSGFAASLAASPRRPAARLQKPGISVCILTRDRPNLVVHALASVPSRLADETPLEIVLIDNGSSGEETKALLSGVAAERPEVRLLRLDPAVHPTVAYDRGVAAATHDVVAFLDDDNAYAPDGLARLVRGVLEGRADVVVSTLDVFDHAGDPPGPGVARWTFIGEAASAGLFCNLFGDTALAIRRDSYGAAGGFPTENGASPSFDWVLLARAQAAGARIAVLQEPAVRYRRDIARAGSAWMKLDKENGRSRVFAAYRGGFDGELVARIAQKRQIEDG